MERLLSAKGPVAALVSPVSGRRESVLGGSAIAIRAIDAADRGHQDPDSRLRNTGRQRAA
ncbi:hypothetical protein CKO42_15420 [Lamprobacter modestohalophilus]|uniref:Uncharacterized protein n=1 Tax=Lamprobacter modestohalophilus TaxID=1064514 RepID=A0A9X0WA41_9GAMM|nr:hypothetical protein [Lamprobacter modestohalophilus]